MAKKNVEPKKLTKYERKQRRKARRQAKRDGDKWNCERWLVTFRRLRTKKSA